MASTVGSRPSRATAVSQGSPCVPATLSAAGPLPLAGGAESCPAQACDTQPYWLDSYSPNPIPTLLPLKPVSTFIYLYLKRHFFK